MDPGNELPGRPCRRSFIGICMVNPKRVVLIFEPAELFTFNRYAGLFVLVADLETFAFQQLIPAEKLYVGPNHLGTHRGQVVLVLPT
ncbi:hypothetical protein CLV84_0462 [Neolewinella xylanilytica]|uniref:Uncharacterized protein n=1 Tax=Neolewinella xylanilytica TaxID=1514080 RepID=A0A2S6I7V0_9BACT|nr:hypothetical protein CLV84_0462 [Neolewinella xylanilytica]